MQAQRADAPQSSCFDKLSMRTSINLLILSSSKDESDGLPT
jgi:hypothetical protein